MNKVDLEKKGRNSNVFQQLRLKYSVIELSEKTKASSKRELILSSSGEGVAVDLADNNTIVQTVVQNE